MFPHLVGVFWSYLELRSGYIGKKSKYSKIIKLLIISQFFRIFILPIYRSGGQILSFHCLVEEPHGFLCSKPVGHFPGAGVGGSGAAHFANPNSSAEVYE